MPARVQWSQHETALLIDAYLKVINGADFDRTAKDLSITLRSYAKRKGMLIDDTYRNVNGIKMQLHNVQYLFTNGQKGLSGVSDIIKQMYTMYCKYPSLFQRILDEAIKQTGQATSNEEFIILDEKWKKCAYSLPYVYSAIMKDRYVLVRTYLGITAQVNMPYSSLNLSWRAMNCLYREHLPNKSINDILDIPLKRLANIRTIDAKTIKEILDAVSAYVKTNYVNTAAEKTKDDLQNSMLPSATNSTSSARRHSASPKEIVVQPTNLSASMESIRTIADEQQDIASFFAGIKSAIVNNRNVLIRDHLKITIQINVPYRQLNLSGRAMDCLDKAHLPRKSINAILDAPLYQLASIRNVDTVTIKEILDAVSKYVKSFSASEIDDHKATAAIPSSAPQDTADSVILVNQLSEHTDKSQMAQSSNQPASMKDFHAVADEQQDAASFLANVKSAIAKDPNVLVRKYIDSTVQANVPYSQLNLSVRAVNCLNRECYPDFSINAILDMPLIRLAGMKNAGAKTIKEILDAVTAYVNSNPVQETENEFTEDLPEDTLTIVDGNFSALIQYSDLIAREEWDRIEELLDNEEDIAALLNIIDIADTIGAEMTAAAISSAYPTAVLLPSLQSYLQEEKGRKFKKEELQKLVDLLPAGRAELLAMPFAIAHAITYSRRIVSEIIDDRICLKDLPQVACRADDNTFRAISTFLSWCRIDIKEELAHALSDCAQNERSKEVVQLRAEGKTLEEIGTRFGVTRERVRQIEAKVVRAFSKHNAIRILYLISADREGDTVLTEDEICEYCDHGKLLVHLLKSVDCSTHFHYSAALSAFVLDDEEYEEERVRSFVDDLPDRIEDNDMASIQKTAEEQGIAAELVILQIRANYRYLESVHAWQRGTITMHKMCLETLKSYGLDGVHLSSAEELQGFRNRMVERFGHELRMPETDRALVAIVYKVGMLRDRSTYIAAKDHLLPENLLSAIRTYIDHGSSDTYMYSTIFTVFQKELMEAGVDNRYFLQGILRHEWDNVYVFSKECISKGERITNIYGKLEEYIKNAGDYVSTVELKEAFPGVTDAILNAFLQQRSVLTFNGRYIHADNLHLDDEFVQSLHQVLEALLRDGFEHHSKELYERASVAIGSQLDELNIPFQSALFSVAAYLFDNEYTFSRPWIAKKNTVGERTVCELRNQIPVDDEDAQRSIPQTAIEYKGTLLDVAITVLQKTNAPMTVPEITAVIQQDSLYPIHSTNPNLVVYQALNNAFLGKGNRNAALGRHLGTRDDERGRKVYYLRDTDMPIFADLSNAPVQLSFTEEKPDVDEETAAKWNRIIAEEFEDGLRLNGIRLRRFRGIYEQRFHESLESDDETLIAQLKMVCDFREDRVYPKQEAEQSTLIHDIRDEITTLLFNGATGIYPQQIFLRHQAQLAEQLSVYSVESLKAMLMAVPNRRYILMYGVFCFPSKVCDPKVDVGDLFKSCYEPLNYAQMSERLWYMPLDRIKHGLVTEPSIVSVEQETYFFASNFPISSQELTALERAMRQRIEDSGYIVAKDLRALMQQHCPNAMMDTAEWKDWGIRNVMAWLLRDRFDFNGVVICEKGAGMDTHQVFRSYCRAHQQVTLNELKDLCAQLGLAGIYWDSVFAELVRISKTEFVAKAAIHFDIAATDAALSAACSGDYVSLKRFTLFMTLPSVEYPWNGYLLESYLRGYSSIFYLCQAGAVEHSYIGAMVRRSSKIRTFSDLVIDVLANDDSWESSAEAYAVLRDGGYRSSSGMTNEAKILKTAKELRAKRKAASGETW